MGLLTRTKEKPDMADALEHNRQKQKAYLLSKEMEALASDLLKKAAELKQTLDEDDNTTTDPPKE